MSHYLQHPIELDTPGVAAVMDELSLWSARFGLLLLEQVPLQSDMQILDLGCGTGFPTFELAQLGGATCRVIGVDVWHDALARATSKAHVYRLPNAHLVAADGARLPFPAATFDLIVSNLGINNFADAGAALAECFRVTKPGGRLALTTNLQGHMREFYDVFRATLQERNAGEYLERLTQHEQHRGTQESRTALVEAAGFRIARVVEDQTCFRFVDGSALLNHFFIKLGFLDAWRGVVDPADEQDIFAALEARLNDTARRHGELRLTVPMLYIEAVKPDTQSAGAGA
jgi:ubiquinone/menaquinone biosynthesis C-methylase UbiE